MANSSKPSIAPARFSSISMLLPLLLAGLNNLAQKPLLTSRMITKSTLSDSSRSPLNNDTLTFLFNTTPPQRPAKPRFPQPFRISLPPGMIRVHSSGSDVFGFRYPGRQRVYVYIDYYKPPGRDTIQKITDAEEISLLLYNDLNTVNTPEKLDIGSNPFDPTRDTWLVHKERASILLYNIDPAAARLFLDYIATFTLL